MEQKKRTTDWEKIEKDYRAGMLSIREISRQNGVSDTAVRKKAKERGWLRDLSEQVRAKVRSDLVRGSVCNPTISDEEIVEGAAAEAASLIRLQRSDIANMQSLEQRILAELGDEKNPPSKVHVSSFQGEVTQTPLFLTVSERATALQALANVQHKRIQLQRQAYNLNDEAPVDDALAKIIEKVQSRRADLVQAARNASNDED